MGKRSLVFAQYRVNMLPFVGLYASKKIEKIFDEREKASQKDFVQNKN